jgi:Domain of unknown function (DUF4258)
MNTVSLQIERERRPDFGGAFTMSKHALKRMYQRGLSIEKVQLVLLYGEAIYDRGALCFRVGRRVIARCAKRGLDIRSLRGLHVIASDDGAIITIYRNNDFRRPRNIVRLKRYEA